MPDCRRDTVTDAPKGTALPLTPDFKGNLIARYSFPMGDFGVVRAGRVRLPDERVVVARDRRQRRATATSRRARYLDLAFGLGNDKYTFELFVSNVTDEDAPLGVTSECTPQVCGVQT